MNGVRTKGHFIIGEGARGLEGLQPPLQKAQIRAKPLFFGQKLNFSGQE